jgi:hypothetical protein
MSDDVMCAADCPECGHRERDHGCYMGGDDSVLCACDAYAHLRAALAERDAQLAEARRDVIEAVGELLVPVPEPGTDAARVMIAGRIMRRERDDARTQLDAAHEQLREADAVIEDVHGAVSGRDDNGMIAYLAAEGIREWREKTKDATWRRKEE